MNKVKCSGTLGDTYINVCKLYNIAGDIKVSHYTKHVKEMRDNIKTIYNFLPDIKVDFVSTPHKNNTIVSHFIKEETKTEPFPKFGFQKYASNYIVIVPKSGKKKEKSRCINIMEINKIIKNHPDKTVFIIGIDEKFKDIKGINIVNLINKTTLDLAIELVAGADKIYAFQGLFCFIAMSQKIPTFCYIKTKQNEYSVNIRTHKKWEKYLKIRKI